MLRGARNLRGFGIGLASVLSMASAVSAAVTRLDFDAGGPDSPEAAMIDLSPAASDAWKQEAFGRTDPVSWMPAPTNGANYRPSRAGDANPARIENSVVVIPIAPLTLAPLLLVSGGLIVLGKRMIGLRK